MESLRIEDLSGCGTTKSARENFEGPHVWHKPGLSGYLVCLVHLVSLIQPNKLDRPNRPNEQDRLADFSSILLYIHLTLGHPARIIRDRPRNPIWHEPTQYGRVTRSISTFRSRVDS